MSMDTWILGVIPDSYDISGSLGKNYFINLDLFETNSFHVWVYLPAFTIKKSTIHVGEYTITFFGIPSLPKMLLEK